MSDIKAGEKYRLRDDHGEAVEVEIIAVTPPPDGFLHEGQDPRIATWVYVKHEGDYAGCLSMVDFEERLDSQTPPDQTDEG